jgi:hypothetical protein
MFGTLQDRLPKELALHGIRDIEKANKYIKEHYLPRHNEQFCVKPASLERAFIPWVSAVALEDILCLKDQRMVQNDNTVRYKGKVLQIPKNEYRHHYIKAEIAVHEYYDHQLAIFYGPLCIGRYQANGELQDEYKSVDEIAKIKVPPNKSKLADIGVLTYYKANYFGRGNKAYAV